MNIDKVINKVRNYNLNEMITTASVPGKPGFSSSADSAGPVAGYDPVMGSPIDLRRKKERNWNIFFKDLVKTTRKKRKNRK